MPFREAATRTEIKSELCRSATATHDYELDNNHSPHCQLDLVDSDTALLVDVGTKSTDASETDAKYRRRREPSLQVKLKFLTGLRGLACLLVVHHHAGYLLEATIAPSSVDTFFVLSAFLLTALNEPKVRNLVSRKEGARNWMVTLAHYSIKRFLRVYPLFALTALALTCMPEATRTHYYNLAHYNIKTWSLWDILTFKKRWYLFWTMAIQITYYCLLPFFLVGVCLLGKLKWFVVGVLYCWVYYEGWHTNRTGHGEFRPHLSTFVAGSLAALVYSKLDRWMKKHRFEPLLKHVVAVRALELVMVSTIVSDVSRGYMANTFIEHLFPCQDKIVPSVSIPLSSVMVIEALMPSAISRALEWNALCFTGKVSFSIYLLHPFVNFLPWLKELERMDQFAARLVLVYALASTSYFLVERNCERLAGVLGKKLVRSAGPMAV